MTAEAVLERPSSDDGGKGLKSGSPRARLEHRHRRRLDRAGLQPGRDPRRHRRAGRPAVADHRDPGVRPDPVRLGRLPAAEQGEPDCGTTFTWATKAFGPKTGWMGGWGIIAADVLVMASLAQVAGQYVFLLFNANGIGAERRPAAGCCSSG